MLRELSALAQTTRKLHQIPSPTLSYPQGEGRRGPHRDKYQLTERHRRRDCRVWKEGLATRLPRLARLGVELPKKSCQALYDAN